MIDKSDSNMKYFSIGSLALSIFIVSMDLLRHHEHTATYYLINIIFIFIMTWYCLYFVNKKKYILASILPLLYFIVYIVYVIVKYNESFKALSLVVGKG